MKLQFKENENNDHLTIYIKSLSYNQSIKVYSAVVKH